MQRGEVQVRSFGSTPVLRGFGLVLALGVAVGGSTAWAQSGADGGAAAATPLQSGQAVDGPGSGAHVPDGVDILSDTQGVDFKPYVKGILKTIYGNWVAHLPPEARPPQNLPGVTDIRFTIAPNGMVTSMHLDASTRSTSLNNAAWGAITRVGTFPPLPKEFTGPHLELRIRFRVNQKSGEPGGTEDAPGKPS